MWDTRVSCRSGSFSVIDYSTLRKESKLFSRKSGGDACNAVQWQKLVILQGYWPKSTVFLFSVPAKVYKHSEIYYNQ